MLTILWITAIFIVLYLIYPLGLCLAFSARATPPKETEQIDGISLILLTYNAEAFLKNKIDFLINELAVFENHEMIIIDDSSRDSTQQILDQYLHQPGVRIIRKTKRKGIADSMNRGVLEARLEIIIFCDQRQQLCPNSLQRIVEPLKNKTVGAVSGCLSPIDKDNCDSIVRRHENFIKTCESKLGSTMGVYGPLYAIKKQYFAPIPNHIILDDLYLSLHILKSKQIVMIKHCAIIDDNFAELYNYQRAKRYLTGLLQLLFQRGIIFNLSKLQITMLLWHKYLRIFIPVLLFLSYIACGILIPQGLAFLILFGTGSLFLILAILQMITKFQSGLVNLVRINLYYLVAFVDILVSRKNWLHLFARKDKASRFDAENKMILKT
ncbi:MAG TPA: glycosyltransferase [Bacteroidales bacterium]|nr:glycosyltransferase [Bacteroidales bacterium]